MKRLFFFVPLFTIMAACNNSSTSSGGQTDDTSNAGTEASSSTVEEDGVEFVTKAASGGMMEVALGKLAQTNAQSTEVKNFGSMMVEDHGKAGEELKTLAASKNITLSGTMLPKHQEHVDELSQKKGAEFDKEYTKLMLEDHREDIEEFEEASNELKDPDIKAFAGKLVPVLKKHLESIKSVNSVVKASDNKDDLP